MRIENHCSGQILDFVAKRGISRLVHFTPLHNLLGIFETGALWSRAKIKEYAKEHNDFFLLDYIRWNDDLRLDGRKECINLSIQRPNGVLFSSFRKRISDAEIWCVLEISPTVMARTGAIFTVGNAASSYVKAHGAGMGLSALQAMFADRVVVGNNFGRRICTRNGLPENCPTSMQAEVMVSGAIDLKEVMGMVFQCEEHARRAMRALQVAYPGLVLPAIKVSPKDFE